jgi:hypothetical protein
MEADFEKVFGETIRRANVENEQPLFVDARVVTVSPFLVTRPGVDGFGLRIDMSDGSAIIVFPTAAEPEPGDERTAFYELADWELRTPSGVLEVGPGRKWHLEPIKVEIQFVRAPGKLLKTADEILRSAIRAAKPLVRDIKAVAKALIDETDEMKRATHGIRTDTNKEQLDTLSPPEMIEKARALETIQLPKKELQSKIRAVAKGYVRIAAENQRLYEEFKTRYIGQQKQPQGN